jgi:hypothetical protein
MLAWSLAATGIQVSALSPELSGLEAETLNIRRNFMKTRVRMLQKSLELFVQGMDMLHFSAPLEKWIVLARAMGLHWPGCGSFPPRRLDEVANEIASASNGGRAIVGIHLRNGTVGVRFQDSFVGGLVLYQSIQQADAFWVEIPEDEVPELLRQLWDAMK